MSEGKFCNIGGAIKQIVGEYCNVNGVIKQGTLNALDISNVIKSVSVGGVALFICEQVSDRLYAIDRDQADLDGWPKYGGTIADPKDVACDSSGNSYWACTNNIHKVALDGTITWTYAGFPSTVLSVCVDADGNVYAGDYSGTVKKLNSGGSVVWSQGIGVGPCHALAIDYSANTLYAAFGVSTAGRVYRLLGANGNYSIVYNSNSTKGPVVSIAIDEGYPDLYIGTNNGYLMKIGTSGYEYWGQSTTHRGYACEILSVRVGHDGFGYYVNGSHGDVGKFILSAGATDAWSFNPAGAAYAMSVAVDQFSKVYASYKIAGSSIYNLVYKLTSAGAEDWNWNPYTTAQMYGLAVEPGIKAAGF